MKIIVKIKPWSKTEGVKNLLTGYEVKVKEPAKDGKANKRAIELLAKYFNTSKSSVVIKSGHTARTKIVEISERF